MVSSGSRTASVAGGAAVEDAAWGSVAWTVMMGFLLLGDGAAAPAELGNEFPRLAVADLGAGVGGEDLDVVQAAAAGAGAPVRDGGDHLALEGRLEEIDV